MSKPLQTLRKNQKYILAGVVVVLIVIWVVGDALQRSSGPTESDETLVTWKSGELTDRMVFQMHQDHNETMRFLFQVVQETRNRGGTASMPFGQAQNKQDVVLRYLIAQLAAEEGVTVSDEAVKSFLLELCERKFTQGQLLTILQNSTNRLTPSRMYNQIRNELLAQQGHHMLRAGVAPSVVTPTRMWDYYNRIGRTVSVQTVAMNVGERVDKVDGSPTPAELKELFEEGKARINFPDSAEPGFRREKKVSFDYVKILKEVMERQESQKVKASMGGANPQITEEDIKKYYEDNKDTRYQDTGETTSPSGHSAPSTGEPTTTPAAEDSGAKKEEATGPSLNPAKSTDPKASAKESNDKKSDPKNPTAKDDAAKKGATPAAKTDPKTAPKPPAAKNEDNKKDAPKKGDGKDAKKDAPKKSDGAALTEREFFVSTQDGKKDDAKKAEPKQDTDKKANPKQDAAKKADSAKDSAAVKKADVQKKAPAKADTVKKAAPKQDPKKDPAQTKDAATADPAKKDDTKKDAGKKDDGKKDDTKADAAKDGEPEKKDPPKPEVKYKSLDDKVTDTETQKEITVREDIINSLAREKSADAVKTRWKKAIENAKALEKFVRTQAKGRKEDDPKIDGDKVKAEFDRLFAEEIRLSKEFKEKNTKPESDKEEDSDAETDKPMDSVVFRQTEQPITGLDLFIARRDNVLETKEKDRTTAQRIFADLLSVTDFDFSTGQFRQIALGDVIFSADVQTYSPTSFPTARDSGDNDFRREAVVYWLTEVVEAHVPEFEDAKADVEAAWKRIKARDLVTKALEGELEAFKGSSKTFREFFENRPRPGQEDKVFQIHQPAPFSWMKADLSTQYQLRVSTLDGYPGVGKTFFEAVKQTPVGETVIAWDEGKNTAFLVYVDSEINNESERRKAFHAANENSAPNFGQPGQGPRTDLQHVHSISDADSNVRFQKTIEALITALDVKGLNNLDVERR